MEDRDRGGFLVVVAVIALLYWWGTRGNETPWSVANITGGAAGFGGSAAVPTFQVLGDDLGNYVGGLTGNAPVTTAAMSSGGCGCG